MGSSNVELFMFWPDAERRTCDAYCNGELPMAQEQIDSIREVLKDAAEVSNEDKRKEYEDTHGLLEYERTKASEQEYED